MQLTEAVLDERDQRLQCLGSLWPLGGHVQRRAGAGRQHHQAHDRGAADRVAVARYGNNRVIAFGALHEFRRGAGVQTFAVTNGDDRLGACAVIDLWHRLKPNLRPTAPDWRP